MNTIKLKTTVVFIAFTFLITFENYAQVTISSDDLKSLPGDWTGTLTYIDYSSNEPYSMPADLKVEPGANEYQFQLYNIYPNEPKANNKDKIKISKNGQEINKRKVKSKERLSNGSLQITTEYSGKDNNKPALIRNIYTLGVDKFIIRKEVKYENSDEWFKRNEFNYKREK